MAYNSLYEWQEIEALELGNKKIDELRKEINNINTLVSTKNCGRLYKVNKVEQVTVTIKQPIK